MNEMEKFVIDEIDKKILNIIQENGDISNLDLSRKVGLAPSSCLLRVKNLKEHGLIKKTVTIVNEKALGYQVMAFLHISLKALTKEVVDEFVKQVTALPQVVECYMTTGAGAFLIKVIAKDLQGYRDFILGTLLSIPSVGNVETSLVIGVEKDTTVIPIN